MYLLQHSSCYVWQSYPTCCLLFTHYHLFASMFLTCLSSHSAVWFSMVLFTSSVCSLWIHCFLTRANFWAGVATFQCSDAVVFVLVFAIPVCLDPCDPVDCGNSVPPCHSEPVWRDDLVSRKQWDSRKPVVTDYVSSQVCSHCFGALHVGLYVWIMLQNVAWGS